MRKILLTLMMLLLVASGWAQSDDTTKYIKYPGVYGIQYPRYMATKVLRPPVDTIYTKWGLATIGSTVYVGNGVMWTAAGGAGSATRFGVLTEDVSASAARNFELNGNIFSINNASLDMYFKLNPAFGRMEYNAFSPDFFKSVSMDLTPDDGFIQAVDTNTIYLLGVGVGGTSDGTGVIMKTSDLNNMSLINVKADSITFKPGGGGKMNIDSLRTSSDTTTYKPMSRDPVTGIWVQHNYWPGGGIGSQSLDQTLAIGDSSDLNIKVDSAFARVGKINHQLIVGDSLKGTDTLFALGTSITKGQSTEGYPLDSLYHALFSTRYGLTVDNRGTGGATMQECEAPGNPDSSMINALFRIPTYTEGNWLSFEFGTNDAWTVICPSCDTTQFKIDYNLVLDNAITTKGWPANRIIIIGSPYNLSSQYVNVDDYSRAAQTVAQERGTYFAENYNYMLAHGGSLNLLGTWGDSVHPSTYGYVNMMRTMDDLQLPINQVGHLLVNGGVNFKDSVTVKGRMVIDPLARPLDYQQESVEQNHIDNGLQIRGKNLNMAAGKILIDNVSDDGTTAKLQINIGTSLPAFNIREGSYYIRTIGAQGFRIGGSGGYVTHGYNGVQTGGVDYYINGSEGTMAQFGGFYSMFNPNATIYYGLGVTGSSNANLFRVSPRYNNIGIGMEPSGTSSAILDITSTTQGLLGPRMNTTQQNAISSPATGLLIFNTDTAKYRFYNGSAWETIGAGSGSGATPTLQQVLDAGSTLTSSETVNVGTNRLNISGSSTSRLFDVTNSDDEAAAFTGAGSGPVVTITNLSTGAGILSQNSSGGLTFQGISANSSGSTILPVTRNDAETISTPAAGLGGANDKYIESSTTIRRAARFIWKWADHTDASRTSEIDLGGVDNATEEIFMNIQKDLVRINNNADTLATKAYARSVGGGGSGDVTKVGTPVNNQIGIWTGDGTIEGDADATFDGTTATIGGAIIGGDAGIGAGNAITLTGSHTSGSYSFLGLSNNLFINVPTGGYVGFRQNNAADGWYGVGPTWTNVVGNAAPSVPLWIQPTAAGNYGAIIQAATSQTGNLIEFRNSSNTGISAFNATADLGLGTSSPNAAAALDITSTTKGLLLPRMTKAQRDAISSPVAGLAVYQTDNTPGLRVYNGTSWMRYTETAD